MMRVLLAAFAVSIAPAFASGPGTSAGQFLRIPVGARAPALGGAFSALADDITAIHYNPAGLAQLEGKEAAISYNAYFKDTASQFLGYGQKIGACTLAGAINLFAVKDIEKRSVSAGDADKPDLGTFKAQDMALSLGWGHKFDVSGKDLNVGAALKYITSDLGDTTGVGLSIGNKDAKADTVAVDLGVMAPLGEPESMMGGSLQGSLAVLNLGGELKYANEGDPLPLNIKPGVAWKGKAGGKALNAVLDADLIVNDSVNLINLGFEYWMIEQLGLRAGYQLGRDKGAGPGIGAGLGFRHAGLGVDYAFVPFGDLGDTHRVSLSLKF